MSGVNITVYDGKNAQQAAQRAEAAAKKAEDIQFLNLRTELPAPVDNVLPSLRPNGSPVEEGDFMEVKKGIYTNVDDTDLEVTDDKGRLWFDGDLWAISVEWELPVVPVDGLLEKGGFEGTAKDLDDKIPAVSNDTGSSNETAASQWMVSERIPNNISNYTKEIDGVAFLSVYVGKALNIENVPTIFAAYGESRYTNYFDISAIDKIRYIGRYGSESVGMIFLDSDGQIVSVLSKVGTGEIDITVDKPVGAVIARASSLNSTLEVSFPKYGKNTKRFEEIDSKTGYQSVEFFQFNGYTRYSDGAFIEQSDWRTSDFIPYEDFVEASVWGHASAVASVAYFSAARQESYLGAYRVGNTRELVKKEDLNHDLSIRFVRVSTSVNTGIFPQNTWLTTNKVEGAKEYTDRRVSAINSRLASQKFMHMSFDDVIFLLRDLTLNQSVYQSVFENPFLAALKTINEEYGMVFSMYCFLEDINTSWVIEDTPDKFAAELTASAAWLKWGFHTKNSSTNYGESTAWYARTDYNRFIANAVRFTGSIECIDRAPRLQNFRGNLESCQAIRDAGAGVVALLTADDSRASYYLDTEQYTYINTHERVNDVTNFIHFFKTEKRLEQVPDIDEWLAQFLTVPYVNMATDMVLFTHEVHIYPNVLGAVLTDMVDKIAICAQWALVNGYSFDFPMNRI